MGVASPERLRDDLLRRAHSVGTPAEFTHSAARLLNRAVPFEGICMLTMDPATLLPTGEVVENGLPPAATVRMSEIECRGGDVNSFSALAVSGRTAASLSGATAGDLDRSLRHRELRRPSGFGDELRAVLTDATGAWGALTLLRADNRAPFSSADVTLLRSLAGGLAEGVRRAILLQALPAGCDPGEDVPGVVLLADDNSVSAADIAGERWIDELGGGGGDAVPPAVVNAVANRAGAISTGGGATEGLARARVRAASGTWLVVRGSALVSDTDGTIVVTLEPITPHQLAPLIADAYELSDRERAVTQLVARGPACTRLPLPGRRRGQRLVRPLAHLARRTAGSRRRGRSRRQPPRQRVRPAGGASDRSRARRTSAGGVRPRPQTPCASSAAARTGRNSGASPGCSCGTRSSRAARLAR